MLKDCHIDLLESHWVVICLQYIIIIFKKIPMKVQFFFDRIIYADLQHPILIEISCYCWDPINNMFITFCMLHVFFQSYIVLSKIM
jgi:hypothetical protein